MISSRIRALLLSLIFPPFFIHCGLFAQQFGGDPPSLKWLQINTDTARIIFPVGMEKQAQQVAAIVHTLSGSTVKTIGGRLQKVNIVFRNQTTIANGYVALAPFRSEFQLTPEQNSFDLGSLPWQKMLAIHEYRHVQQFNNFRVGLSKGFYYLFGEGGQALTNSLAIPNWFWEGDAVYQETLVSDQGRGRLPFFFNGYRALWSGGKNYSWMKLRNGSLRDYVPDWYPLGYMLVSYGRQRYGDEFWEKVTLDAAAFKGLFYPLQTAIRKYSGLSFRQFRKDALDHYLSDDRLSTGADPVSDFARSHKHFAGNEEFPQFAGRDTIVYARSSYKRVPVFILRDLDRGKEEVVRTRAISLDNYFSYRNGKIVYAGYETDPRWSWRDYSVIRVLDATTGKDRRITSRSKYFAPDISADGEHIIAVEEGVNGTCALRLLNSRSGEVEKRVPNPDSLFYTYPKFFSKDTIVSAVRDPKGEMSLALVSTVDGGNAFLLPFSFQTIGFPSVSGDTIWFTASRDGQDRVYGVAGPFPRDASTKPGTLFRVRLPHGDPMTGQYEFQAGGDRYAWNVFTAVGYRSDTGDRRQLNLENIPVSLWARGLPTQGIDSLNKGYTHLLDRIGSGSYPVKRYPASFHLINFHSWRPYIADPDYTFSLVSENILNTLQSELYVTYNRDERYKQVGVDATYGALFPYFDAGWDYTFDRNAFYGNQKIYWNETEARAGFSIPLNFTRHLTYTNLQFGSDLVYNQRYIQGVYKDSINNKPFAYIDPFFSFSNQSQQAQQQIYPRFVQTAYISYSRAVTALQANQFLATGYLYLPGIAYTHSLVLGASFQQRDTLNNARFTNNFPFSRGYTAENFYRMWLFSANYNLPLLYPDLGIGNIVYFQRIRANLYYDYTKVLINGYGPLFKVPFRSYGTEIFFDTQWWNQLPISFGIRYSRLVDPDSEGRGPNQWELILPLNLLSQGYSVKHPLYNNY